MVVGEIVDAFAELDGLPAPPLDTYTPALAERVHEFQRLVGLEVDVMDAQTTGWLDPSRTWLYTRESEPAASSNPGVPNVADSGRAAPGEGDVPGIWIVPLWGSRCGIPASG